MPGSARGSDGESECLIHSRSRYNVYYLRLVATMGPSREMAPVMSRITVPLGVGQPSPGRCMHTTTLLGTQ